MTFEIFPSLQFVRTYMCDVYFSSLHWVTQHRCDVTDCQKDSQNKTDIKIDFIFWKLDRYVWVRIQFLWFKQVITAKMWPYLGVSKTYMKLRTLCILDGIYRALFKNEAKCFLTSWFFISNQIIIWKIGKYLIVNLLAIQLP